MYILLLISLFGLFSVFSISLTVCTLVPAGIPTYFDAHHSFRDVVFGSKLRISAWDSYTCSVANLLLFTNKPQIDRKI
jgi:hypothetical protein